MVDDLLRLGVGSGLASVAVVDSPARDLVVGRDRTEDTGVGHVADIEACRLDLGCRRRASRDWEGKSDSVGKSKDLLVRLG